MVLTQVQRRMALGSIHRILLGGPQLSLIYRGIGQDTDAAGASQGNRNLVLHHKTRSGVNEHQRFPHLLAPFWKCMLSGGRKNILS